MYIKNDCRHAPLGLLAHVRRGLNWIEDEHLAGLDYLWLMDSIPEETTDETAIQAKTEGFGLYGAYKPREGSNQSYILLFVQEIYRGIPAIYAMTPVPTLRIARTLAHEVAHHLVSQRGYVFQPGEKRSDEERHANNYAAGVLQNMKKRWWYRLGQKLINDLAHTHYVFGVEEWKRQEYCAASDRWFKAWDLNPELENEVKDWYWQAKERCAAEKRSNAV